VYIWHLIHRKKNLNALCVRSCSRGSRILPAYDFSLARENGSVRLSGMLEKVQETAESKRSCPALSFSSFWEKHKGIELHAIIVCNVTRVISGSRRVNMCRTNLHFIVEV